jgi:hypothetical protein
MAGAIWMIGGFLILAASLTLNPKTSLYILLTSTLVMGAIPITYSYRFNQKLESQKR